MSGDAQALANAATRTLRAYDPGHDLPRLRREVGKDLVELGSNENSLGPSPAALAAARAALDEAFRYPDPKGGALKGALAARFGVDARQVTLGNGSHELLMLLAQCFAEPGTSVVYSQYGFAVFAIATAAAGAQALCVPALPRDHAQAPLGHDLEAMAAAVRGDTRLVYLANPNNPTGTWNTAEQLRAFLRKVPDSVVVALDEAYHEYSRAVDCPDGTELLAAHPNLVVLRTFSKAHALAGVRVGYALSHPDVADMLNRVRQPFNVGIPGLAGATAAVGDAEQVARAQKLVAEGSAQLHAALPALGVKVHRSAGNFVLADVGAGNAVYDALLREGVIVRPVAGYGLPRCVRITIGTAAQNERLIGALSKVMKGRKA